MRTLTTPQDADPSPRRAPGARRPGERRNARLRQLAAVADLGGEFLTGLAQEQLLARAAETVAHGLDAELVTVLERHPDGTLRTAAGFGWGDGLPLGEPSPVDESQGVYQLASGAERLVVDDLERERRFRPPPRLRERGMRAGVSCRIDGPDGAFGVLAAHTARPGGFDEDDASFVAAVANLLGSALRRHHERALRAAAEAELRETAERFRMLAENAQDIVFRYRVGADRGFDYVSPALERILGIPTESVYADPAAILARVHPDDRGRLLAWGGEHRREPVLLRWQRPDGRLVWLERRTTFVRDASGTVVAAEGIVRDVTERVEEEERRRSLEEQLHQAQKMEAVGRLAGGVAHDFNNLLLAVRGYGELALRRLARGEPGAEKDVEEMLSAADRAAGLTRQLLAFSRRQVLHAEVLDLRGVVAEMAKLLRRLIGEQVDLVTELADEPVLVRADRAQLEQVLANLAVNARDAMPGGGRLSVDVAVSAAEAGERLALLTVADSGDGMDADTAARAFEPFFTTKGEHGTGLGLSTVHGIVTQSDGRISLDSAPGAGTTIAIALPLADAVAAPPAAAARPGPPGRATVLLVEDDPNVRVVVARMLEERGYVVLQAAGGDEAVDALGRSDDRVALVLTDLVLRGPGGRETAGRVRALRPEVKVLYMSGYAEDGVAHAEADEPGTAFVQKPFSGDQLAERVRELLEEEA